MVLSAFGLVKNHKWVSVQSDCGLTSKSSQHNFSQSHLSHLIVRKLFNNVLKIRQNPLRKTLRKMAMKIKIFSSYHRKPSFSKVTTLDNRSHIYRLPSNASVFTSCFPSDSQAWFFYSMVFKRGNSPNSVNVLKNNNNNNSNSSKNVVGCNERKFHCVKRLFSLSNQIGGKVELGKQRN